MYFGCVACFALWLASHGLADVYLFSCPVLLGISLVSLPKLLIRLVMVLISILIGVPVMKFHRSTVWWMISFFVDICSSIVMWMLGFVFICVLVIFAMNCWGLLVADA